MSPCYDSFKSFPRSSVGGLGWLGQIGTEHNGNSETIGSRGILIDKKNALVKSNLGQKKQHVSFRDVPLNSGNIAAEILHVHGVILILT